MEDIKKTYYEKQETNAKILESEKKLSKLRDMASYGGFSITFTKSNRGTATPAEVKVVANTGDDLAIAIEVMDSAISCYQTLISELKKDLEIYEERMNHIGQKC